MKNVCGSELSPDPNMCTTYSLSERERICSQNFCTHEVNSNDQLLVLVFRLQSSPLVRLFTHAYSNPALVAAFENRGHVLQEF